MKLADRFARWAIVIGGIGTIAAILSVCVFLFWVAWPLFLPVDVAGQKLLAQVQPIAPPVHMALDDFRSLAWTLSRDGTVQVFRNDTGERLSEHRLGVPTALSGWALWDPEGAVALGYADGTIRLGSIRFVTRFVADQDLPPGVNRNAPSPVDCDGELFASAAKGQWRATKLAIELDEASAAISKSPIVLVDHVTGPRGSTVASLSADGSLRITSVRKRRNLGTGKIESRVATYDIEFQAPSSGKPRHLLLSGRGDQLYLVWEDGELLRFDTRQLNRVRLAESVDLVPEPERKLTALVPLLGRGTLIAGDSSGSLRAWFKANTAGAETLDGSTLVAAHELPSRSAAVTALGVSSRTRLLAVGYADGYVDLVHVTSQRRLVDLATRNDAKVAAVAIAPKDDELAAITDAGLSSWAIDVRHPEATLATLMLPVWYEGYPAPAYVWQSSSGTDEFEPKISLVPLIFGTLKATFYSLLFGVPVALLAAVYASEFLTSRVRGKIKPTIELMAGLPSVVLGFLAALVLAPLVERWLPVVLALFGAIPLVLLSGAFLWQLLPERTALRWASWRFLFLLATLPLGVLAAIGIAPAAEKALFSGDLQLWLDDHQRGTAAGGWMILLLPLSAVLTAWIMGREVTPRLRKAAAQWTRLRCGLVDLCRFLAGTVVAFAMAWAISMALSVLGWDPRGSYVDTYVQRNALVVGFVMGFAIIPLIYTIAEDALSSVPEHLRSASLGAGATPWQTATRIIIPTAMSGLFSAVMIGLGRAVGETMIVLMAAGNTPIIDVNIFNGFRTLSANLAVELPEAVRNSTHFRTLFLAALALFAMTFVINTIAEAVRQRFRKQAFQL